MNEIVSNHKIDRSAYGNNQTSQGLWTLSLWQKFEANRLLLKPRIKIYHISIRLFILLVLIFYVPFIFFASYAVLVCGIFAWMNHLTHSYEAILNSKPNITVMTVPLARIVRRYKLVFMINCMVWCTLTMISLIWLPLLLQVMCIAGLNVLLFIFIMRCYVDRMLIHQTSVILIISQLVYISIRLMLNIDEPDALMQAVVYYLYILLIGCLIWSVGNRLNRMHTKRSESEYSKLILIDTLSKSQSQLQLEQQALMASNQLVQQFYSGAAHDLRQPVYAMQLYVAMLSDDPSQNTAILPKITQSCIAINDMFNTLFDYQQLHMHDNDLAEIDMSIQDTFKSLALHFQPIAIGKGLQIRFKPLDGTITTVPMYIVRILSNLIANALRYTSKGGVLVRARKTAHQLRFQIWDSGIGIDDSNLHKIFNEFYKVNNQTVDHAELNDQETDSEGLGLGLAIVKQLSSRLDQTDISVKSRVGRGSVFTFTFPIELYKPT